MSGRVSGWNCCGLTERRSFLRQLQPESNGATGSARRQSSAAPRFASSHQRQFPLNGRAGLLIKSQLMGSGIKRRCMDSAVKRRKRHNFSRKYSSAYSKFMQ